MAEEAFQAVRRGFIQAGNGYDTAMVSLDLTFVYTKQRRVAEFKQFAEEMHSVFESKGDPSRGARGPSPLPAGGLGKSRSL